VRSAPTGPVSGAAGPAARRSGPVRTRRLALGLAVPATVALGLGIRAVGDGAWTGPAGDVLYAVLIYLLVAFLIPARPRSLIAAAALSACVLVELLQLTGLPADLARSWPPIRLALGTTFGLADLVAYAGGCVLAAAADRALGRGPRTRPRADDPAAPGQG
jgi:hypothetical protein